MVRRFLIVATALILSACGGIGPNSQAAQDTAALRAQVAQDLAPAYDDIAAFCLAIIQGQSVDSARLTRHGFKKSRNRYERTWQQGQVTTGLRVRARTRSPQGCSVDTKYGDDFDASALENNAPLRAAWTRYLTAQGFTVAEAENESFALKTTEGQTVLEFEIKRNAKTPPLSATRNDLRIKIATYSNDTRTTEYMEVWQ